jgi:hypothetical protein
MAVADVTCSPSFLLLSVLDCSITKRYTVTNPLTHFISLNPLPSRFQLFLVPSTSQDTPCPDAPAVTLDPEAAFSCTLAANLCFLHTRAFVVFVCVQSSPPPETVPMCRTLQLLHVSQTQIRPPKICLLLSVRLCFQPFSSLFSAAITAQILGRNFLNLSSQLIMLLSDNANPHDPITSTLTPSNPKP